VGIFICFQLLNVTWILAVVAAHQVRDWELWELRNKGDHELTNIRAYFSKLVNKSYGDKDLFITHFENKFAELEGEIREVEEKSELLVTEDHFLSAENVLAAIQGDPEPIYRFTWEIDENEELFKDLNHRLYFESSKKMLGLGSMKEVRAIIIVDNVALLNTPRVSKLLDFFQTNDGFDCKIVASADYTTLCEGNGIPAEYYEIGIFANRLLFLTMSYEPTKGVFTKDTHKINRYKSLFDKVWDSVSLATRNPSKAHARVSLEELLTFDKQQPKEKAK